MKKIILVSTIIALIVSFFAFDLHQYLDFAYIKSKQQAIADYYQANPLQSIVIFFVVYVLATSFSIPGASILSLLAGAVFGLLLGSVLVIFAATIGATIAFWLARYLLGNTIQERYADKLKTINAGIEKDGAFYLLTLRLLPVFPFFIINVLMGLTPIRTITYVVTSFFGMLAGTVIYVNVGTQLANLESIGGILTPKIWGAFILLAVFPWIAKFIINTIKHRRIYADFNKPKSFDYNLAVIGAGSAGLVSSYIAAAVKAKVVLIERHKMGGDCLNTGCVPSKALIRSAKFASQANNSEKYGFKSARVEFDFKDIMNRVQNVIQDIEPHDSVERYTNLGVECMQGEAKLLDPWTVEVDGKTLTAKSIILATGAEPFIPPIPGLDKVNYHTSDTIWNLQELPKKMAVLGGGPIGCELAQCFARLGAEVSLVEMAPRIMLMEDVEISEMVEKSLVADGINLLSNHTASEVRKNDGANILVCTKDDKELLLEFDTLLVAVGRKARGSDVWSENLHIEQRKNGTLEANEFLQTNYPNIYACGDVTGPYQLTHTAAHQAWYTSVNALFGAFKKFRVDYSVIPWCTFTEPEVAHVGLNEIQAKNENIQYEVTRFDIGDLDRAIADGEAHGVVKVLTKPGKDKILGVTIVGDHAGDLISEYVSAMKHGLGLNKILGTIHIYPTLAEANKYAAGEWKRAHTPERLLSWVEKFHAFARK
ncbi:MAG: dihydrolipoyl dehydrogenase [Gammaproteobacteria bacterium]